MLVGSEMIDEHATRSAAVYARLRHDILEGVLGPGEKLRIEQVCARYCVTSTPVREALNQLSMEGFVQRREQRGFTVADASADELHELTWTRCEVEALALREALAHRSHAWEEELLIAWHRLARTSRSTEPSTFHDNPAWETAHRTFHMTLIAPCSSRWLKEFCGRLSDHAVRYRRLAMHAVFPNRDVEGEHRAILDAVLGGQDGDAVALLTQHYRRTADILLQGNTRA